MPPTDAAIAVNRFGLGARPGDLKAAAAAGREYLGAQISHRRSFLMRDAGLPSCAQAGRALTGFLARRRGAVGDLSIAREPQVTNRRDRGPMAGSIRPIIQISLQEIAARTHHAVATPHGYAERLVHFWSNHFTVAGTKLVSLPYAGVFEREAIRPNLLGSFADLLVAAVRHPGMLLYLDQMQSVGPHSELGRRRGRGLNENLAREILELHTVGVGAGYDQADVAELARALSGSRVASDLLMSSAPDAEFGQYIFVAEAHEPGPRRVMAKSYAEGGSEQSLAILRDLAHHPATARRVATKLAAHFIADDPPRALVTALERSFLDTGGDLPSLHRALLDHSESWTPDLRKFKTPYEFYISTLRATGGEVPAPRTLLEVTRSLGQIPLRAPSPAGWPDDAESWAGADAVMKRIEWASAFFADRAIRQPPERFADAILGAALSARTREAVRRAETQAQGMVLALMSPEFQRR